MDLIREKKQKEKAIFTRALRELYAPIAGRKTPRVEGIAHSGQDALFEILSYFGMPSFRVPQGMGDDEAFDYILQRSGLLVRKITLEEGWQNQAALPLLVKDDAGNSLVLIPGKNGTYQEKTVSGLSPLSKNRLESIDPRAYCFYRPLPANVRGIRSFFKYLFGSLTLSDIIWIIFTSILIELFGLVMPYTNKVIYNEVIPSGTAGQIPGIVVILISTVLIATLINVARNISVIRIGSKLRLHGQSAIWSRVFSLPVPFFGRYDAGELYNRAKSVGTICDILGGGLIPAALTASLSLIYVVQITYFARPLALPSLLIVFVILLNILFSGYLQIVRRKRINEKNNRVTGFLYQLLGGITKIRTSGAEARAYARWAGYFKEVPVLLPFYLQISEVVGYAISVAGSIWLYYLAWKNGMDASSYIAFQTSFTYFSLSVMSLADFGFQFGLLQPAVAMIRPILSEEPEHYDEGDYVNKISGEIELDNVCFRYSDNTAYVINNLSLRIKEGEYLGIVGSSGSGKSTLLRILLGFESPQSGAVYYDGKDIQGLNLPSLRKRMGVVLQSGRLFSGNIFSNIAICKPDLTMDEAWEAAERAGIAEDIRKTPLGMHTLLSENGEGISEGQKQRLVIARALASDPDILLLDEATSALDARTQQIVVNSLKDLSCTRIVIAHRLSTIRDCDRIIYLDRGRILEEGSYRQLMEAGGAFAKMAARQLL